MRVLPAAMDHEEQAEEGVDEEDEGSDDGEDEEDVDLLVECLDGDGYGEICRRMNLLACKIR